MISIIVPIYNSEKHLVECIESVLKQSFEDFELILIDDGSTDASFNICKKYLNVDKRIRLYSKENSGVSDTRNYGISKSNGNLIMFLDSDDYILSDMLMVMLDEMKNSESDIIISGMIFFYPDGATKKKSLTDALFFNDSIDEFYIDLEKNDGLNAPVAKLFKKEIIKDFELVFDKKMAILEDQTFVSDYLSRCKKIRSVSYCGYYYRQTFDSSLVKRFNVNSLYCLEKKYETDSWLRGLLENDSISVYYKKNYLLALSFIAAIFREKNIKKRTKKELFFAYKNSDIIKRISKNVPKKALSTKQRIFLAIFQFPKTLSFFLLRLFIYR